MMIDSTEMAKRVNLSLKTLLQYRWQFKNTNEPEALLYSEGMQRGPRAPIWYDERAADLYWEAVKHKKKHYQAMHKLKNN